MLISLTTHRVSLAMKIVASNDYFFSRYCGDKLKLSERHACDMELCLEVAPRNWDGLSTLA
jgi:hypothetical protein